MSNPADLSAMIEPTVLEIWAPSCHQCRAMQPDLDALAMEYAETVTLRMLNASESIDDVRALGVRGTPTLIAVRDGKELFRSTGRRSESELRQMFDVVAVGDDSQPIGRQDLAIRVGAGVVVAGVGLVSGPAWPLVVIGLGIVALGALGGLNRRPAS